ncbi:MAG: nucleoside-binding protein [Frankiales bacterium]|nr:nucleoside-binding protein [Frankiales bacterium]
MRSGLRPRRLIAALAVAGLALTACGGGSESADPAASGAASGAAKSDVKVGLAYDVGGRGDRSFNDSAAAGLDRAKKELGVEAQELSPNSSGSDRGDNLRQLAEEGFDPVIAVGFAYAESLKTVAADFPETTFFIVDDSSVQAPNVKALLFAEEQGSFLVGAAAALKSTTGSVGYIGGVQTPLLQKFEAGFVAGAKQVKPGVKTRVRYLSQPPDFSGFGSPDKGKETANGMYDAGVDVVYAAAGGSGVGVFQAALAKKKLAIGVDSDQYESVGDPTLQPVIMTSMLKRVDVAVFETLEKVTKGEDVPATNTFDLKSEGVGYSTSGGAVDDIKAQLDDLKQQIIDGKITVPTEPAP